ncbi:transposase family protein [Endozoicomonas sp. ONNA2]|uniref:transposase family protein n=1 Tax=Endozoicomonas sp. ONNA2 TaxID=2828741 RepID=UPI0035A10F4C
MHPTRWKKACKYSVCDTICPGYDHVILSWRNPDNCQFKTILVARVPRANCPEHGVLATRVPREAVRG